MRRCLLFLLLSLALVHRAWSQETQPALTIEDLLSSPTLAVEVQKVDELANEQRRVGEFLTKLTADEANVHNWVAQSQLTRVVGNLLRKKRAELPDPAYYRAQSRQTQRQMTEAQERLLEVRGQLADMTGAVRDLPAEKREALESRLKDYEEHVNGLFSLYVSQQQLVEKIESLTRFINEQIVWLRGTPLTIESMRPALDALRWMLEPGKWIGIASAAAVDFQSNLPDYLGGLILLLILLWMRRLMARRLEREHLKPTPWLSMQQLFRLTLSAAIGPLVIAFVAWRAQKFIEPSGFALLLANGLGAAAWALLVIHLISRLSKRGGFFATHLHLDEERLKRIRTALPAAEPFFLVSLIMLIVIETQHVEAYRYSLGRLSFVVLLASAGFFAFHAFTAVSKESPSDEIPWSERVDHAAMPLALAILAIIGVMALLGFYDAALIIAFRLSLTVWLALGVAIAYALIARWLQEAVTNLALKQRRREVMRQRTEQPSTSDLVPESDEEIERHEEPSISNINVQTFRLIHVLTALALLVGLWFIWSDVLPALGFLRNVTVWTVVVEGGEPRAISLANILLAIVVLIAMVAANRNLPSLLEVAFLQHLGIEMATRYAIATVVRYAIVVAGVMGAAKAIGIGWSEVRWLAAAITVGLGFGLQEIFGNFVSGLIILFERPIRVGDTITINAVTGKVARIRIRATTLIDAEHKELIVPNKEFITKPVLNWTLSDTIVRLNARVRVPYGTDVRLARQKLLDVALKTPSVLHDPAPKVIIAELTDAAIVMDLHAHLPRLDGILRTQTEMQTMILESFAEAKIDFTWAQREARLKEEKEEKEK